MLIVINYEEIIKIFNFVVLCKIVRSKVNIVGFLVWLWCVIVYLFVDV